MVYGATSRQGKRGAVGKAKHGRGATGTVSSLNRRKKKSSLVVTFDPDKRKEYLTGFHKRKQERRRFGLDMEAYKVKKRQLEAKKQRREEQKEKLVALNLLEDEKNEEKGSEEKESEEEEESDVDPFKNKMKTVVGGDKIVTEVMTFSDDFTQGKFGDVVTVTTAVGDLESDSNDSGSDLEMSEHEGKEKDAAFSKHPAFRQIKKKKLDQEQHLTLFQRIQQQRKGKALPTKRSKLKEARTARKAMMGKKSNSGSVISGKKRGAEDGDGGGSAVNKLNKKLKIKKSSQGSNKRQKKR